MDKRTLILTTALVLSSCSYAPVLSRAGSTLVITPKIWGASTQAVVSPYTQGSIAHLVVKLYSLPGGSEVAEKDLASASLGDRLVFSNLRANSQYRIKAFAYKALDTAAQNLISIDDASTWVDVSLTNDNQPTLADIPVKLIDIEFNGQATSTVQVTAGGYILPGVAGMQYRHTVVSTVAGIPGTYGSADGNAAAATFYQPYGIAIDGSGNYYIADEVNHTIRKVTPQGVVSTLAGSPGATGSVDGVGSSARFNYPVRVTVAPDGYLYVSDYSNHAIRKISSSGVVTTFAGQAGVYGTANGNGTNAQFKAPCGLVFDGSGNLYVADSGNQSIRKITAAGEVSVFAGLPQNAGSADGTGTAARFDRPYGLTRDSNGNLYTTEQQVSTIRKITASGVVSTIAGKYYVYGSSNGLGSNALFWRPHDIAVDASGNLFITDSFNHSIRRIGTSGVVTTLAGQSAVAGTADGIGSNAKFSHPCGIAIDPDGNLVVTEFSTHTLRLLK